MSTNHHHCATYDATANALVITEMSISDPRVVAECRHWADGRRGEAATGEELSGADLTVFAEQAIALGATAMTAASGVQQSYSLDALVAEVEERSTHVVQTAAAQTTTAVEAVAKVLEQSTEKTRKAVNDAGKTAQKSFVDAVSDVQRQLTEQLATLLGGEQPELMARLQPVLETFSRRLQERAVTQTGELIEKVAKQFDPADPASPMAQHMRVMREAQAEHAQTVTEQTDKMATKLAELTTSLEVARATEAALSNTVTKGASYEEHVNEVMAQIAAGLGDEYVETGNVTGLRSRSKKGDGVLTVEGSDGSAKVVVEMTDSPRAAWSAYLAEAEENRGAQASLGLVKRVENLKGGPILCLGPRRIVMSFDPETDEPRLLRCVIQVLRLAAESAAARVDKSETETADEQLVEALAALKRLAAMQKSAGSIRKSADSIGTQAATLHTELTRYLTQARTALAVVPARQDEVA
ncbi:MAG: hypothetical protein ACTH2Q_00490 [Propionibacteriaceae bacterium]